MSRIVENGEIRSGEDKELDFRLDGKMLAKIQKEMVVRKNWQWKSSL